MSRMRWRIERSVVVDSLGPRDQERLGPPEIPKARNRQWLCLRVDEGLDEDLLDLAW